MVSTNIPKEYYQINDLLEKDSRNVNIASYPDTPYELYSWGQNDNPKVIRQDYYLKEYMFTKPVIYYRTTANYPGRENFMKDFFKLSDKTDENLVAANVGYVLIQKDRINPDNGGPVYYEEYDNYFKNNNNYELAMSNQYFNLYKNKRDTQEITGDNILYKKISSTKYKALITINNDDEKISLVKLNNPFWKAYVERNPNQKWCGQIIKGDKGECFPSNNYLDFGDFNYIFRKQSLNSLGHSNDYANEWVINKNLVNNLPKEYVQVNNDGSKSVEVTILFKPQLYLFAGLIITAVTIILLLLLTVILNNEKLVTLIGKRN
jgi:hypothetical protein